MPEELILDIKSDKLISRIYVKAWCDLDLEDSIYSLVVSESEHYN